MDANKLSYEELEGQVLDLQQQLAQLSLQRGDSQSLQPLSSGVSARQPVNTQLLDAVLLKIKTPLDTIIGLANLLSSSKLDDNERHNLAEIIASCSGELQGVLSEFVSHNALESQKEAVVLQTVSLNELLDELKIKFMNQVFHKGLAMKSYKGLSDEDDVVMIDKHKIVQVFSSLITNSVKFTEHGLIEIGYRVINNELKFYVKDSGVGCEKDITEKLNASHYKLDKAAGVTCEVGLGLATVKRYVELLGGTLNVASEVNVGTVISFKVPYVPAEADQAAPVAKKVTKVLIAEDEEISFLLLKKLLEKGQVEVFRAKNGEEAYEIYKNNPDINLILMDLRMPQVDGYTAAQLIKNESPDIPIIAQSAYSFKEDNEIYGKAFNGYISKPVNKREFQQAVNKYIELAVLN